MGKWEEIIGRMAIYRQTVKEDFILTQGGLHLNFNDNPFNARPNFPSFQLLRVHRNYPISVVDSGRVTVLPVGDKRFPAEIWEDKNPNVYDAVSFFLAPYDIKLPEDYPGRVFANFDGFVSQDGKRNHSSLVYVDKRGLGIDGQYVNTLSIVIPSQITAHFQNWLYHAGRVQAYDENAPFGEGWKDIGRFDLRDIGGVVYTAAQELEKRFKTRILTG